MPATQLQVLRLQLVAATLALSSAPYGATTAAAPVERTRPVLLVPGFASSQLQSWSQYRCNSGFSSSLYRDVSFGDRLWVDVARVLAQTECWIRCLKLDLPTQDEVECKLRAVQGLEAVSELDPGIVTGPLSTVWRSMIHDLVDHFGLDPDQLIVATYDWRLPPSKLQDRDKYFYALKKKIEYTVELDGNNGGLVVIAHSMGNGVFRYFLEWLNDEVGRNNRQSWIDRHISAYFAVGSPLLGSAESLELISSGLTEGLPITQSEIRKLVVSFGSILSFMPISSGLDSAKDNEVLIAVRSQLPGNNQTQCRNYTSADIASGQLFRDMSAHDPIFGKLETMRQRFYADDPVLDYFRPWERPPIASVYSVYGVNVPTKNFYEYENANTPGHWYQVQYVNEEGDDRTCTKTGDGTVTYHSLSWAHTWLGSKGSSVRVTQTPQSVYFSAANITRARAVRHANTHHAEYSLLNGNSPICEDNTASSSSFSGGGATSFFAGLFGPLNRDRVTFFESSGQVGGAATSTGVWEIDGVKHRDILSSPVFLRELRAELRHIFNGKTNSDKSSRPPVVDGDCYWNYRYARCEFPVFCEYRYVFGDVTFDQSCRPSSSSSITLPLLSKFSCLGSLQHEPLPTQTCDKASST
ncbi:unnamed protein product [Hyaloperonospora brassicae]|uniref:Phospholipid:diacylglycerol acyltransferase n=1 Tax=Hyaloperonospora brassicae TaxID=162125 RepID=A0AAV0UED9_HYABA|nr:unnamed protein product [Hyaloperonospora brassicae]